MLCRDAARDFGFFMGILLRQCDRLRGFVADADGEPAAGCGDAEVSVTESADEVEGLSRRLLVREPERVVRDGLLDCSADLRRSAEEAVGGYEPFQRLVGPLEVVCVDEEAESADAIGEVGEDRTRQKLVPERLPEAFDLAERLRMLRPALDVMDALPPQLLLEFGRTAPGRVLPPLVGQDLPRRAEIGQAPL